MTADSGLGWPFSEEPSDSALGWPRAVSAAEPEPVPVAEAEESLGHGDADDLPMASSIREDLAAVSRETAALRPQEAKPREFTPEERVTERRFSQAPSSPESPLQGPAHQPVVPGETEPIDEFGAGESSNVSRETDPHALTADVSRETREADAWPRPAVTRVLSVANQKGGVGKTTSTVNLAAALAQHGARVLVVDLDPQGNASTAFGVEHRAGTPSIYNVLVAGRDLAEVAVEVPGFDGLYCAPATIDLAGAEIELASMVARESRLARALQASVPYDFVFVDCPPSLGLLTVNALVAAQEVLIPIQCEFYALEGLSQLLRTLDLVRSHLNPALHVSTILLTMYDGRTRLAEQVANEVRTHFGDLVLGPTIPRSVRISEAPGYGQTVMTYDPHSRGALAYVQAAREIAERSVGQQDRSAQ
jgi:chromosome partitioning protein